MFLIRKMEEVYQSFGKPIAGLVGCFTFLWSIEACPQTKGIEGIMKQFYPSLLPQYLKILINSIIN